MSSRPPPDLSTPNRQKLQAPAGRRQGVAMSMGLATLLILAPPNGAAAFSVQLPPEPAVPTDIGQCSSWHSAALDVIHQLGQEADDRYNEALKNTGHRQYALLDASRSLHDQARGLRQHAAAVRERCMRKAGAYEAQQLRLRAEERQRAAQQERRRADEDRRQAQIGESPQQARQQAGQRKHQLAQRSRERLAGELADAGRDAFVKEMVLGNFLKTPLGRTFDLVQRYAPLLGGLQQASGTDSYTLALRGGQTGAEMAGDLGQLNSLSQTLLRAAMGELVGTQRDLMVEVNQGLAGFDDNAMRQINQALSGYRATRVTQRLVYESAAGDAFGINSMLDQLEDMTRAIAAAKQKRQLAYNQAMDAVQAARSRSEAERQRREEENRAETPAPPIDTPATTVNPENSAACVDARSLLEQMGPNDPGDSAELAEAARLVRKNLELVVADACGQ